MIIHHSMFMFFFIQGLNLGLWYKQYYFVNIKVVYDCINLWVRICQHYILVIPISLFCGIVCPLKLVIITFKIVDIQLKNTAILFKSWYFLSSFSSFSESAGYVRIGFNMAIQVSVSIMTIWKWLWYLMILINMLWANESIYIYIYIYIYFEMSKAIYLYK